MWITLTLRGTLADYLPPGTGRSPRPVEVADGATVDAVLTQLRVPRERVHLVLVNGVNLPPRHLETTALQPQDSLAIWPPLSGG